VVPSLVERGHRGLFRLLLLIDAGCRGSGVAGELLKVVLQQADFYTAPTHALGLSVCCLIGVGSWGIAHAYEVDAIDRDVMGENQIAHDRLGHLLRVGDCSLGSTCRESLDFDDVTALAFDAAGHGIESVLGVLAQHGLAGTEANLSLV